MGTALPSRASFGAAVRAWALAVVPCTVLLGILLACSQSRSSVRPLSPAVHHLRGRIADLEQIIAQVSTAGTARRRPAADRQIGAMQASHVACLGEHRGDRTCRFRNLFYDVAEGAFFIIDNPAESLLVNYPADEEAGREGGLLDLTGVSDHNVYYWTPSRRAHHPKAIAHATVGALRVVEAARPGERAEVLVGGGAADGRLSVTVVRGGAHLTKRFYSPNVMHALHDDWLGAYALMDIWPSLRDDPSGSERGLAAPPGHALIVFDTYADARHDSLYALLGAFSRASSLSGGGARELICFEDVVVGNSKALSWYQYGYGKPQGPHRGASPFRASSQGGDARGVRIRGGARFAMRRLALPPWDEASQRAFVVRTAARRAADGVASGAADGAASGAASRVCAGEEAQGGRQEEKGCIAIFSRRSTRLILNEDDLGVRLSAEFALPVCWVRMEDATVFEMIAVLRRARLAFGMHGSLLILAIFLPPGAVLVEGFPYGVPADNYTPYRTLAGLPGMGLMYRPWVNGNVQNNVSHPGRPAQMGGIDHLADEALRAFIRDSPTIPPHECCENAHWLHRIFQDTTVDVDAVVGIFYEAIASAADA